MPSNHDTGWTFRDLILRVAEDYGCASQAGSVADIPTNPHNLDKVKRACNVGYREFLSSNPDWTFRNRTFRITTNSAGTGPDNIDGDAGTYRLPRFIQRRPELDLQYVDDSFPLGALIPVSRMEIMRQRQITPNAAPVRLYHYRQLDAVDGSVGSGSGGQWAVLFYPNPDAVYTFEGSCYVYPYDMIELGERHIAGAEHDLTIYAFAMKAIYQSPHEDAQKRAGAVAYAKERLDFSKEVDLRARVGMKGITSDPRVSTARDGYGLNRGGSGIFPGDSGSNFTYEGQPIS